MAERFAYALAAVRAQLRIGLGKLAGSHASAALSRVSLERVIQPDSTSARASIEKLRALASPSIVNHSFRSYIWASLLGQLDGKAWDEELLFVACMVHDLGLTDALHGSCAGARCFTLDGVHAATDIFAHMTSDRAERARRAVLLHLNIEVPGEAHGWEAHYLQAGTALDVVGQRYEQLPREAVEQTLQQHPRLQFKRELDAWLQREAQLRPDSRFALMQRLGMRSLVRRAPFEG